MQSLKLAPDLFLGIDTGEKTCTVRKGKRDIELGPLLLESTGGNDSREVYVHEVRLKTFYNISPEEAHADGGVSVGVLKEAMKRFYPDIKDEDPVTIIFFEYEAEEA